MFAYIFKFTEYGKLFEPGIDDLEQVNTTDEVFTDPDLDFLFNKSWKDPSINY